jgi:hypothetical protein
MRSPALAIAWELWGKNRWGLTALLGCVLALAVPCFLLPPEKIREIAMPWSVIVFALGFLYLASVVLYCEFRSGSLLSGFPARMFTLPVRSSRLVVWPMLYGTAALTFLWGAMDLLVWRPIGIEAAWWAVPLFAVAQAWLQAVCWAIAGSQMAKILAACAIFPALKMALELLSLAVVWLLQDATRLDRDALIAARPWTISLFAGLFLPLAYAVAVWGVARDRRGARLDRWRLSRLVELALNGLPRRRAPFASALRAQIWFEWRSKGILLLLFVASFLVYITLIVVPFVGAGQLLIALLVLAGLVPFVAFLVGYGLGKTSFWAGDLRLPAWQATRPLGSGALAGAKLLTAAVSALATWGLLFAAIPLWLVLLGKLGPVVELVEPFFRQWSTYQVVILVFVGFVGLSALTWGQLVGGLVLSLTGRTWVVNGAVAGYLIVAIALFLLGRGAWANPEDVATFLTVLTWCAAGVAGVKLLGAGWVLRTAQRRGLVEWHNQTIVLGLWVLGLACLVTMSCWLLPSEGLPLPAEIGPGTLHIPVALVALALVLALPLVRLMAAPLALAWNRHR